MDNPPERPVPIGIDSLMRDGFVDTMTTSEGLWVYRKGDLRIRYDSQRGEAISAYRVDDKGQEIKMVPVSEVISSQHSQQGASSRYRQLLDRIFS